MFTIFIEFTYETKAKTKLHGRIECLDYSDINDLLNSIIEWCEINGYTMNKIEITKVGRIAND